MACETIPKKETFLEGWDGLVHFLLPLKQKKKKEERKREREKESSKALLAQEEKGRGEEGINGRHENGGHGGNGCDVRVGFYGPSSTSSSSTSSQPDMRGHAPPAPPLLALHRRQQHDDTWPQLLRPSRHAPRVQRIGTLFLPG